MVIDFELSEEQLTWQKIAHDFSEKEIRPIAEKLDRSEDLLADFPWEMIRKGSKLGLRTLSLPKEYGGPNLDMLNWLVISGLGRAGRAWRRNSRSFLRNSSPIGPRR